MALASVLRMMAMRVLRGMNRLNGMPCRTALTRRRRITLLDRADLIERRRAARGVAVGHSNLCGHVSLRNGARLAGNWCDHAQDTKLHKPSIVRNEGAERTLRKAERRPIQPIG
jgi:hypothetical protein